MRQNEINVITLGCSKNLVDSQALIKKFASLGYRVRHDPDRVTGEIVVINTCGFIGDAQEESINTILRFVRAKKEGRIRQLYVMGCLSQRFKDDLIREIPEVDAYYGKFDWNKIADQLGPSFEKVGAGISPSVVVGEKHSHYAYIKISEGCDRTCSYCAIPLITGKHKSFPMERVLEQVQEKVAAGCSEFLLIAQDSTYYGIDLYGKQTLADLMQMLAEVDGVKRLRLHYAYPTHFPVDILPVMRKYPNICPYIDIALQHSSDHMLQVMRRGITRKQTKQLIERIRKEVPGVVIRTTMMVGHPEETEADFRDLLNFVREMRFERLGAFAYSHEQDTFSYKHYQDNVPTEVKLQRLEQLMQLQEQIAQEISLSYVGKCVEVVVDRHEDEYVVGRTCYDSPEVDPEVLIPRSSLSKRLLRGHYYQVRIVGMEGYDLIAHIED